MKYTDIEHYFTTDTTIDEKPYETLQVVTYEDGRVIIRINRPASYDEMPYGGVSFSLRGDEVQKLKKALP